MTVSFDVNGLTPKQAAIITVLLDGTWHHRRELTDAIDPFGHISTALLGVHLNNIRKKIEPRGELLVCKKMPSKGYFYRLCRVLAPSSNG